MGGLASVATTAIQLLGAANTAVGLADSVRNVNGGADRKAQQYANQVALQNTQEEAALRKQEIALTAEQADSERRAALRRAVAKQRAQFGASGISQDGGSAQAVLLGLFDESEEERAQRDALDRLKTAAADQRVGQMQRVNTLQLTQLRERDRLSNISSALSSASRAASLLS